jgi:hypothetical protein
MVFVNRKSTRIFVCYSSCLKKQSPHQSRGSVKLARECSSEGIKHMDDVTKSDNLCTVIQFLPVSFLMPKLVLRKQKTSCWFFYLPTSTNQEE